MKKHYYQILLLCVLSFSCSIVAQQQYANFENELSVEAIITQFPDEGSCNGAFEIMCIDGTAPYIYSIDAGNSFGSDSIVTGKCQGTVFVHVRDANGKLGLTSIDLKPIVNSPVAIEDNIDSLKIAYLNADNSVEKRRLQLMLSRRGVRYPAEVVTLTNNIYQISTLWEIQNISIFINRHDVVFNGVSGVSIQNQNLIFTLPTSNQIKLDSIAYVLGYESAFTLK